MNKIFWEFISFFGTLLAGLLAVGLAFFVDWKFGLLALGNLVFITAVSNTYKVFFFKPRPDNPEGYRPPNPITWGTAYKLASPKTAIAYFKYVDAGSFPSIHSARSFNLAALFSHPQVIASLLPQPQAAQFSWLSCTLIGFALLIAWSRVVKRRHDKVDITAGAVLGLATALVSGLLFY